MKTISQIEQESDDRFNCDQMEPRRVDFQHLQTLIASAGEGVLRDVRNHILHWHCRKSVLYYLKWIKYSFSGVSRRDFHHAAVVRLDGAIQKESSALLSCQSPEKIKSLLTQCVARSYQNAHYDFKRDRRFASRGQLPADVVQVDEDALHDIPDSWEYDASLIRCRQKLAEVDQVILNNTARGTTVKEIAKLVGLAAGHVTRRKHQAIEQMRRCLGMSDP